MRPHFSLKQFRLIPLAIEERVLGKFRGREELLIKSDLVLLVVEEERGKAGGREDLRAKEGSGLNGSEEGSYDNEWVWKSPGMLGKCRG